MVCVSILWGWGGVGWGGEHRIWLRAPIWPRVALKLTKGKAGDES